jgi:hypothetical protein
MIAAQIANLPNGVRADSASTSVLGEPVTKEQAAEQLGTTPKANTQARVITEFAPEDAAKVVNGSDERIDDMGTLMWKRTVAIRQPAKGPTGNGLCEQSRKTN